MLFCISNDEFHIYVHRPLEDTLNMNMNMSTNDPDIQVLLLFFRYVTLTKQCNLRKWAYPILFNISNLMYNT
jgi:hypothetical protein